MGQILIIEDNPVTQQILCELAGRRGHDCMTASNGREGMRVFETRTVDLVITDIIMPEQEGLETIRAIRSSGSMLPIIAMSGSFSRAGCSAALDYLEIAAALGASGRLRKPFSASQLYRELDRLLPVVEDREETA
jgi:CheY-like chemotaxis protein